jgi:molecular chaperone HtpG
MSEDVGSHEFTIDLRGLIKILAQNLYSHHDVFIREMIQNAQDSLTRRRVLEGDRTPAGRIQLKVNWAQGDETIVIEDNGAGLTKEEIHNYLTVIGRSGTDATRQEWLEIGSYKEAQELIGQFGIGLLSAFIVARRVVIQTKSVKPNNPGWRWESLGDIDFKLSRDEDVPVGCRVTLYVSEKHRDVLDPDFVRSTVRKYADFVQFPIHLNSEGVINAVDAPWHRTYRSDNEQLVAYADFINRRFPDMPLSVIPVRITEPYPIDGVLYITDRRVPDIASPGRVDIYQSRIFIAAENSDLLPKWAKFVRGVIDSPVFTPNAARDNVQQDAQFRDIRQRLGKIIIAHLKQMAHEKPQRFQEIMDWHHLHVKGMALDPEAKDFFQEIAEHLPVETNKGLMSLRDYLRQTSLAADGRRRLLYFSERRSTTTQFFILADAKEILVIDASFPFDEKFLREYQSSHPQEVVLEQLDFGQDSDAIFQKISPSENQEFRDLVKQFKDTIPTYGGVVRVVRFAPDAIPAVMTLTEAAQAHQKMKDVLSAPQIPQEIKDLVGRLLEDKKALPITLNLNADNPTIRYLKDMDLRSEVAVNAITAIYNNSLMMAQHLMTPQNAQVMFQQFNQVVRLLIEQAGSRDQLLQEVEGLRKALKIQEEEAEPAVALTRYISCFVAFDFNARRQVFKTLSDIFQNPPYFWDVVRADRDQEHPDLLPNILKKMHQAHCFVVELSEANPNVMMELGIIMTLNRPFLLLWDKTKGTFPGWSDIAGKLLETYDGSASPDEMRKQLEEAVKRQTEFRNLKSEHKFLSPNLLKMDYVDERATSAILSHYLTVDEFLKADLETLRAKTRLPGGILQEIQEHVSRLVGKDRG